MENHLHEWVHLLLRWIHFIVGVAWIGASFYFNWLENNLDRAPSKDDDNNDNNDGIAGHLWAIHGGGFYHLKKFKTGPAELPAVLHWFKWEAYATWLSGFALLVVVYYFNASLFLIESGASGQDNWLGPEKAVALGVAAVLGSWFVYDGLCRSPLKRAPVLLAASVFAGLVILAWMLSGVFSGRAAYIHVGAAIGTMMAGNVFFVIIPAQKEMVSALASARPLDPGHGENGLIRSRHNNYLTLPVLFIMISVHFPATYGHGWNWAVLAGISVAGWLARHYFNARQPPSRAVAGLLPLAFLLMVALAWMTAPAGRPSAGGASTATVGMAEVAPVIQSRCAGCHARVPTQPGFAAPPAGLMLESPASIELHAAQIFTAAVATKTMPIGNLTGMTDEERDLIAAWYYRLEAAGAALDKGGPVSTEATEATAQ